MFVAPSGDDTAGFQSLLSDDRLCDLPSRLFPDRLDLSVFFVNCQSTFLRVRVDAVSNETGEIGQAVRVLMTTQINLAVQLTNANGTLFIVSPGADGDSSDFSLSDREGLLPPVSFIPQGANMQFKVKSAVADAPWTTESSSPKSSLVGLVYYIEELPSSTELTKVMKLQINLEDPDQSIVTPCFPSNISDSLVPMSLYIRPISHVLFVITEQLILEYDIIPNTPPRIIFNVSASDAVTSPVTMMITQVAMSEPGESDSDVLFIGLTNDSPSINSLSMPMILRVHRKSGKSEVLAYASLCFPGLQIATLMFTAIDQALFLSCDGGTAMAASFNGSIADPSTVASFRTITNPMKCSSSDISKLPTPPGANVVRLAIACRFQNRIVSTTGASLSQTISYVLCANPTVISSKLDEFGRQVLLHDCGQGCFPVVLVDGRPKQLTSLCNTLNTLLHRAGTSEVYALCEPFDGTSYVTASNTDNSVLQQRLHPQQQLLQQEFLFQCPDSSFVNADNSYGNSLTFFSALVLSANTSLVFTCSGGVWSLPLRPAVVGPATLLLNFSDPTVVAPHPSVLQIIGVLASSHHAFINIVFSDASTTSTFAVEIPALPPSPTPSLPFTLIDGENILIDEEQNAIWYDRCIVDFMSGTHCSIYRQQPIEDFSSKQLMLNMSMLFRAWTVDAILNKLIVVTNQGEVWSMPAYNISIIAAQASMLKVQVMPTCIQKNLPMQSFLPVSILHNLGLFLLPCELTRVNGVWMNPHWAIAALPLAALTNVSVSGTTWLPFLRAVPDCELVNGPFVIGELLEDLIVACGISMQLSYKFQCGAGQQWWLGSCELCITGWSKSADDSESSTALSSPALLIPQCHQCAPGSVAVSSGTFVCLPCGAGTYHDPSLGEVCRPCPTGTYQNATGSIECIPCQSGTYAPSQGSVSCSTCPLGSLPDPLAVTCVACPRGTYAPSETASQCVSCEGRNQNGLDCSNGLASVRAGYFGFLVDESDGSVIVQPSVSSSSSSSSIGVFHSAACAYGCPGSPLQVSNSNSSASSYASSNSCPSDDPQPGPIHYCCWPRVNSPNNILCANCVEGHVAWSSTCAACTGVNGGLITLLLIFCIALIVWLYSNASNSSSSPTSGAGTDSNTSGHVTILLYFIQISSLQLGHASDWLQWLHWSNLSASSTKACIAPIDAYQQTAMNLAVPVIFSAILIALAILHIMYDACVHKCGDLSLRLSDNEIHPMFRQSFLNEDLSIDSARELQDVSQGGADLSHSDSYRSSLSMSISAWNNNNALHPPTPHGRLQALWSPLSGSYSPTAWYWNAFVLLRRMLFSACAVFLADSPNTRFPVFTMMHFVSLLLHQLAAPYSNSRLNFVECGSYSLLLAVSVLLSMQSLPYPLWFELSIVVSITCATLGMIVWIAWITVSRLIRRNKSSEPSRSTQDQPFLRLLRLFRTLFMPASFSLRRYFRTFLLILLFCYTSVTSTVLSFLHCVDVASDVRLVFDTPTMDCTSNRYHMYRVWVIMVLAVYTIGFPVTTVALLAWKKKSRGS